MPRTTATCRSTTTDTYTFAVTSTRPWRSKWSERLSDIYTILCSLLTRQIFFVRKDVAIPLWLPIDIASFDAAPIVESWRRQDAFCMVRFKLARGDMFWFRTISPISYLLIQLFSR